MEKWTLLAHSRGDGLDRMVDLTQWSSANVQASRISRETPPLRQPDMSLMCNYCPARS